MYEDVASTQLSEDLCEYIDEALMPPLSQQDALELYRELAEHCTHMAAGIETDIRQFGAK